MCIWKGIYRFTSKATISSLCVPPLHVEDNRLEHSPRGRRGVCVVLHARRGFIQKNSLLCAAFPPSLDSSCLSCLVSYRLRKTVQAVVGLLPRHLRQIHAHILPLQGHGGCPREKYHDIPRVTVAVALRVPAGPRGVPQELPRVPA